MENAGKMIPLRVILKTEWLSLKNQFKSLKKQLINLVQEAPENRENKEIIEDPKNEENFIKDCLIKIKNLPEDCMKQDIKVAIKHFCQPEYVDFKGKSKECVVRFGNKTICEAFVEKYALEKLKIKKEKVWINIFNEINRALCLTS
jgi:hypothetical protein